jgi:hypothetical protein
MSAEFIAQDVWPRMTGAVRDSRRACMVAVAYFGAGASRLLPLPKGSRLVVDASERAVRSGQTCPADLKRLVKAGVRVYSVANLHAKVLVLGRVAYIGSANVSSRSASQLVEAVVRTTEESVVRAARAFVQAHCLHELTPAVLERLARIYRPPLVPGGARGRKAAARSSRRPTLPRLMLAQLHLETWSAQDQAAHDADLRVAKERREHPRSFELESFRHAGKCPFRRGDVVIQVTNEGGGRILATAPGNVLHVRTRRYGARQVSFVYLECPVRRRRSTTSLARALGRGAKKRLRRNGTVRDADFARALLAAWAA